MTKEQLSPAAVLKAALAANANSNLDLEGWSRWICEALAIQPETKLPAKLKTAATPALVDPARVRILRRMPLRNFGETLPSTET